MENRFDNLFIIEIIDIKSFDHCFYHKQYH